MPIWRKKIFERPTVTEAMHEFKRCFKR